MRRYSSTWLYLAAALGLFCFIYFIESRSKTTDEARATRHLLFEFNPLQVNSIEITNAKGSVTLQKEGDRWRIIKPVNTSADPAAVEQVLEGLRFVMHSRVIPYASVPGNKEETIKLWNLDPPAVHVVFKTPAKTFHFLAGRNVALSEMVYARASDQMADPVHIVSETFKKTVDKDLAELRSRAVFDFDPLDATQFSVREFGPGIELSQSTEIFKNKNDLWAMQKPLVARTNQLKVDEWIRKLLELKIIDFVSDEGANLSAYGLDAPSLQITMQSGRGQHNSEATLLTGSSPPDKPGQLYGKLQKSSTVFTIDKGFVSTMIEQLAGLRSRFLMEFEPKKVYRVSFESEGKILAVRLENGYWKLEDADGTAADEKVIYHILNQFDATEINFVKDSALDLHPYGLDNPTARVVMQQYPSETPATIELDLGKIENGQVYVKTSLEPFVYGAPLRLLDFIPREPLALRRLQVIAVNRKDFASLKIEAAGKPPVDIKLGAKGLYQTDDRSLEVDQIKADRLITLLEKFRGSQWLGPLQSAYGLESPAFSFTLATSSGQSVRLDIGARLPDGGYAARIDKQPIAFEILEGICKLLAEEVVMPVKPSLPGSAH